MPSGVSPPNTSAVPDPDGIYTLGEFAMALDALRGHRSYSDLAKTAKKQPLRNGGQPTLP